MSTVVQVGDQLYRLSATQKGLIECCSATNTSSVWGAHTIMPDAKELFLHDGWLAFKDASGNIHYETASGWHTVDVPKVAKVKSTPKSKSLKPKKTGCLGMIFKLIKWSFIFLIVGGILAVVLAKMLGDI